MAPSSFPTAQPAALAGPASTTSTDQPTLLHLDGTTLEGGGQLFRLALSLSSLKRQPLRITDIRGKRERSHETGKAGGLKAAHHAGAQWLAQATGARTQGLEVKSTELVFEPPVVGTAGTEDGLGRGNVADGRWNGVWKDVRGEGGKVVRRESEISLGTPGSVFLVLQAILPHLLFSSLPIVDGKEVVCSREDGDGEPAVPIRLTLRGGTNVFSSLSYEYAEQVLFPMLHKKLGIGPIKMNLVRRGWSIGGVRVGKVIFDITPLQSGTSMPAFTYKDRGEVVKIYVSCLGPSMAYRSSIKARVTDLILRRYPDVDIEFPVDEDSGNAKRLYLLLVAETANGYRLGRDWLYDRKINNEKPEKTVEDLVSDVFQQLREEVTHGGCCDEYLQDQLVVFQALCQGKSTVSGRRPSLHTQTARWVAEQLLHVAFDENGDCEGVAFMAESGTK